MSPSVIFWTAAIIAFSILEAATVGLVSIWFIGGAIAAFFAALCDAKIFLQVAIFLVVSVVLLALVRPLVKKHFTPRHVKTNADRLVGQHALVTEQIDNLRATGAIKINGVLWTAKSVDGSVIAAEQLVRIERIEGAKVYVQLAETYATNA